MVICSFHHQISSQVRSNVQFPSGPGKGNCLLPRRPEELMYCVYESPWAAKYLREQSNMKHCKRLYKLHRRNLRMKWGLSIKHAQRWTVGSSTGSLAVLRFRSYAFQLWKLLIPCFPIHAILVWMRTNHQVSSFFDSFDSSIWFLTKWWELYLSKCCTKCANTLFDWSD